MITSLFRVCTGALMLPLLLTGALASNLSDPELTFKNLQKEYQSIEPGASRCQRLFVLRPLSSKLDAFIESYPTSETAARLISGQTVGGFNLESLENEVDGLTSAIDQEARELVESTHDTIIELVQSMDWEPGFGRLASVEKAQEMLHQRYSCRSADIRLDAIQIANLRAKFVALREIDAQLAIKEMVIGNIVSARAAGSPCARVELLIKAQESFNHITVRFDGADAVQEFADGGGDSTSSLMALRKETNWQEKACLQHAERQNKDANAALVSIVSSFKKAKTETRREEKLDLYADVLEALDELLAAYPGSTIALEHGRTGCFGKICREEIARAIEDLIEKRQAALDRELAAAKDLWKAVDKEQKVGEKVALYNALIDRLEILVKQFSGSTEASALLSGDVVGGVSLREAKTRLKSVIDQRNRDASTRHKEIERLLGSVENSKNPNTRLEATLAAMEALQQLVVLYTDAEINARPELHQLDSKINSQIEQEQSALNAVARSLFEKAAISFRKGTSTDETSTSRRQTLQKSFDILEDIKTQFPLSAIGGAIINTGGFEGLALSAVQQEIDQLEAETIKRQAFVSEIIDLTQCSLDKETTYPNRITCLRAALTTVGEIEKNFPGVPVQNLCADEGKSCLGVSKTEVTSRIAQLISVCERDANTIVRNAKSVFATLEKEGLTRTRGLKQLQGSRADLDRISQDFACGSVTSESFTSAVQVARDRLTTRINKEEQLLAAARKQFVHTQSVCAKANLDVRRKSPQIAITALDECLKVSNNFSQQYPKTKFSQVISKGGAFVPLVRIGEYRCQALSGNKCFLQGSINRIDAALVINPEEKKVVLSANQAESFNLAKGIKMRSNESGVSRTLYLTHIDVIRFGSIEIKDVEAFIDPLASNERVVLGDEVLKQFDITTTDDAMTLHQERIDGKTVIAGLGMQSLKDMRYRLIQKEGKQVLTGLKEVQSLLKQAKVIQSVKRFDERLILISKAESLLEQIAKAHKIIPDNIKDRMDSDRATFRDFKSVTVNAREDAAVALCGAVKNQIENARRLSDSIEILKQIEVARAHLDELDYHFSNTRKGTDLRTDPSICGLSEDQLANEVKAAGKIKQVIACKTDGLKATFFGTRMKYYDCAVRGLEAIEQKYADTIIGVRVKDGIVLNDVSKNIVQDLINNERLAQESFKKVGPMIEEEVFELGYLRRYTFMSEALELIDKIMDLDSTVDLKQLRALQKQAHETRLDAESKMAIEPVMITLNGQCYQMGSLKSDFDAATDEKRHQVCLEDFAIAKYEVTFHEYDQFVRATGADKPKDRGWGREDRPVIYVSLDDIEQYIEWINGETGKSYRLPTEAEWEFAARGGQQSRYSWGDEVKEDAANCMNCGTEWSGRRTAPVGSFNANPYGLYDMAGNVSENTCSIYRKQYDDSERVCALGDASGNRVLRGGSWKSHSRQLRPANRRELSDPTQRSPYQGFRLATDG